jgi:hypothetical protein
MKLEIRSMERGYRPTLFGHLVQCGIGGAENAEPQNAGPENDGPFSPAFSGLAFSAPPITHCTR